LSCHYQIMQKVGPPPACKLPSSSGRPQWGLPRAFSKPNKPSCLYLSSQERCSSPLIVFMALLWAIKLQQLCILLVFGVPGSYIVLQKGPHKGRAEGDSNLPLPAVQGCWCSPGYSRPLGLQAHCWLMCSFSSIRTSKSFSAGQLSVSSSPSLYSFLRLPQAKCNTLHLVSLNFIRYSCAHFSTVSRSHWMTSLLSVVWTAPLSLVQSANLLRVHSIPLLMSLIKTLKNRYTIKYLTVCKVASADFFRLPVKIVVCWRHSGPIFPSVVLQQWPWHCVWNEMLFSMNRDLSFVVVWLVFGGFFLPRDFYPW